MSTHEEKHAAVIAAIRATTPAPIVQFPLNAPNVAHLDLSLNNPIVAAASFTDNRDLSKLLATILEQTGASYGIGGYNEKRGWYARGAQFSQGDEIRSIHLGVDIWAPAETAVFTPYDAVVHSAQDNDLLGDYGPTIILQHTVRDETFYTLYGHLSRESLVGIFPGKHIPQGVQIGTFGAPPINGDWPPHLHFQLITDMLGKVGDYPGVAAESQREYFLSLCPDPNEILRTPLLTRG